MRRMLKVLAWIVAASIAFPLLLAGVILIGANIEPGRRLIETLTPRLTGGMVRIGGLAGRFPDELRLGRITVADTDGVWLAVDNAALDWSPSTLIAGKVSIDRLEAERVAVTRLPAPSSSEQSSGSGTALPRVAISRLRVARVEIGEAVAGRPIVLTLAGSGDLVASDIGTARLTVTSLEPREAPDRYTLDLAMDRSHLHATLDASEAAKGLLAGLAQLPDLGAVKINASVDGPLDALASRVAIEAGLLRANLDGTVDMVGHAADMGFSVASPAMAPAPGIAWASIRLDGKMHGPFVSPEATGVLSADGVTAAGAAIGALRANISGDASGKAQLHAILDGLRVPGPSPDLLAGGSLTLDATALSLDTTPSVQFTLRHDLFAAEGTAGAEQAHVRLTLPDITPFATVGGVDLHGQTALDIGVTRSKDTIDLAVKGGVGIAGGMAPVPALVGTAGTIDLAATMRGETVNLTRFALDGSAIHLSANGQLADRRLNADWTVTLSNLGAIRPGASGTVSGKGHVAGPLSSLTVTSDITGDAAAEGGRVEQFTAQVNLDGLPDAPSGSLTAGGTVLGAPLAVAINAARRDGGFHVVIDRAAWKSLTAGGTLDLAAGEALPTGKVTLAMTRLADLTPVLGRPVAGSVTASLDASAGAMRISAVVAGAAVPGTATIGKADLQATIGDPSGTPTVDGTLALDGVEASGLRATARLAAKGPADRVALTLGANIADLHGSPARVETSGTLDATGRALSLASLQGTWSKETIRLLAPAKIGFTNGVTIDRLRLGLRQAELAIAGSLRGDALDVKATLTNLPADIAAIVAPSYAADGTISGEVRLTGTTARPQGTLHIAASSVRLRSGPGRGLPLANLTAAATLEGANARLDGKLTAGTSNVTLTGLVPQNPAGRLDLRVGGGVDLAILNPLLAAQGRDVRGRVDLAVGIGGTLSAPQMSGTLRLANGDVQDASFGVHISAINALIRPDGDTIRLDRFDGKAGSGTISGSGTVRLPPGMSGTPAVDLTLRSSNAKLVSSDLMTALIDANLTVRGEMNGNQSLGGTIFVREADIQVPENLPPSIAVIPVRDAGTPPPKPSPPVPVPDITLNLTLDAPSQIYIRGRGIDVELGGKIVFAGTAARPLPQGGLQLRRGTFSLAGQSLNLTEGTIDFSGGSLTNPQLKLVASSSSATQTATLTVSGGVKNPKITLSSIPDMPQDDILSQLLFNTAKSRLSPFQVAEIAAALASISGVGSGVGDPLAGLRSALGLDQLSVGSGAGGAATLEAGRYVARGVRVGAAQGATGGGTQATVQIDLAKGLKLQTTTGTGAATGTATPGTSSGTSVGLTYQFEY